MRRRRPLPRADSTASARYQHVADLVAIGPHSAGTEGGRRAQEYIVGQLQGFGCTVEQHAVYGRGTPVGDVNMNNIIAKIPGTSPDILMFTTHYDTKRMANFVGADDGGSSSGVMLELARSLCARKNALTVWIAFFDGEEAFNRDWADPGQYLRQPRTGGAHGAFGRARRGCGRLCWRTWWGITSCG